MNIDLLLAIVLALFALLGFWFGFLHTLGSLLGTMLGAYGASKWFSILADWLLTRFKLSDATAHILGFIIVFILLSRICGVAFMLIEKFFDTTHIVPFFGLLNRLAGCVLGLIEGLLVVGLILSFAQKFPIVKGWTSQFDDSRVAQSSITASQILWPVLENSITIFDRLPDHLPKYVD